MSRDDLEASLEDLDLIKGEFTGEIKTKGDTVHFDIHEKGFKDDSAKPRLDLVLGDFATALWGVGLVGTFGANKYTDRGWHEVDNGIERYSNALLRHYFNFKNGERNDRESNLPHLAHLAWNALAILQLYMEEWDKEMLSLGTIEEVASNHPDFKPIYSYSYGCHYKED